MGRTSLSQREQRLPPTSTDIPLDPAKFAAQAPGKQEVAPAPQSANGMEAALSTIEIKSTPDGAEITVDDKYMGSTPSTLRLSAGDHKIKLEKPGFKPWEKTLTVSSGGTATGKAPLEKPQNPNYFRSDPQQNGAVQ